MPCIAIGKGSFKEVCLLRICCQQVYGFRFLKQHWTDCKCADSSIVLLAKACCKLNAISVCINGTRKSNSIAKPHEGSIFRVFLGETYCLSSLFHHSFSATSVRSFRWSAVELNPFCFVFDKQTTLPQWQYSQNRAGCQTLKCKLDDRMMSLGLL